MDIKTNGPAWFYSYVWDSAENDAIRDYVQRRLDYWNGEHDILGEDSTYANGQTKSTYVMNWVKEIVTRHNGCMTQFQVEIPSPEGGDQVDSTAYDKIREQQRLDKIDSLLVRDALLCGYGVEFQGFDAATKEITISRYSPSEWAFLWDSEDELQAAVRCVQLEANTVHNGEVLENDTEALWVYTQDEIGEWIRDANTTGEFKGTISENPLGRIPVVVWLADEEMAGIISDELIAMNDAFNSQFSIEGDDINNTVDAIVKMWGVDSAWVTANESTILEKRMLPFDHPKSEQDAEFLSRKLDIGPHSKHLDVIRENIHIMGNIPDTSKITGATGSTSGVALRLAFTPMEQAFQSYSPFLVEAVHDRIALLNARLEKLQAETIPNPKVIVQFRMPANRVEEWQYIGMLKGIVSQKTMLSLLTDIEDPAKELQNVVNEMGEDQPSQVAERIAENEARAANIERLLVESDARTTESIGAMITANDALIQKLIDAISKANT